MTRASLAERLREMKDSPHETSLFELEDVLRDLGYRAVYEDDDLVLYRHPVGDGDFHFSRRHADRVPVSIVVRVATRLLENLRGE